MVKDGGHLVITSWYDSGADDGSWILEDEMMRGGRLRQCQEGGKQDRNRIVGGARVQNGRLQ